MPTTTPTYGIITAGPMFSGSTIIIDSNTIDSASIGIIGVMNNNAIVKIDSNAIIGASLCYPQVGVYINETGSPTAVYSVDNNSMQGLNFGVYANDAYADTIYKNNILLADTLCSSPIGLGIAVTNGQSAQIVDNTVRLPYHSSPTDYANDNFTGIYVEMSPDCYMTCNNTYYFDTAIGCSGASDINFSVWGNNMTSGINIAHSIGIEITNNAQLGTQIIGINPSDNQWIDSFACRSYLPSANPIYSIFDVRTGATYDPDGSCIPKIQKSTITGVSYDCTNIPPRFHHSLLDSIAKSKVRYSEYPDTSVIIAKQTLIAILWSNDSLLVSDGILYAFNDSILTTSLGEIMQADTALMNGHILTVTEYSSMFYLTPASNIEANIQTVGQILINVRSSSTHKLSLTQIGTLQTLANKCPYTDGIGVYQARSLLAYYTGDFTIYHDEGCSSHSGHKLTKKTEITKSDTSKNVSFNLYPNPNNGNFTLVYNLGSETAGKFEIYNDISMEVGEYLLNSSSGTMQISNPNLREGLYFYKVYTASGVKKVGKIVIIR